MRPSYLRSFAIVFFVPIVARAHLLLGYFLSDPLYRFGGIGSVVRGPLPGEPTIDPNLGIVDHALTTRAMDLLFSGHLPWWNSLEGFGTPLAGEMQSSALFAFSPLVLLPNGNLLLNIILAILAGVGMLLLLHHIGFEPWPALVGAVLYETCGTFSWLSGSWSYAIPWLPFLLLGAELCRTAALGRVRIGIAVVATSLALLIYSGFIETAYFEGLTAVVWVVARFFGITQHDRVRYVVGLVTGGVLGFALAAPIVVAFGDTLAMSFVGMHDAGNAGSSLPLATLLQKLAPYAYGPIFATRQSEIGYIWGNTGGYTGFVVAVLAVSGCFAKRHRALRIALAVVIVMGFSAIFGGPLLKLLLVIPGAKFTAYYRYVDPSIAFAVSTLAAFAIEDALSLPNARRPMLLGLSATAALTMLAYGAARKYIGGPSAALDADLSVWHVFSLLEIIVGFVLVAATLWIRRVRVGASMLGLVACAEAVLFLVIPTFSNPTGATIALGGVRYLHAHMGLQRTYSLGPLHPNYGSYFGVSSLDYNDLPDPARTVAYVKKHLDPLADPINFLVTMPRSGMDQKTNFSQRVDAFRRVGVKYVLAAPDDPVPARTARLKYRDLSMAIYELPNPTPYFTAPGCRLMPSSRTAVTTICATPSTVCRLELNAPGWTADVDGRWVPPRDCNEIFQAVAVPAGVTHLRFDFTPPYEPIASIAAASALVVLLLLFVLSAAQRRPATA